MQDRLEDLARTTGLCVTLVRDVSAARHERWLVIIGLSASGVGATPDMALLSARDEWERLGSPTVELANMREG